MALELINPEEKLRTSYPKINAAIQAADRADNNSKGTRIIAEEALEQSKDTQTQLNTIVIKGDSSVEAAQARVSTNNTGTTTTYITLKNRLDAEHNELTKGLSEKASKEELKATDATAKDALAKANNPLAALTSAGYKITTDDLSDDVLEAMSGNTNLTIASGLNNNSGVVYPLRQLTRNGILATVSDEIKNAILAVKVINAKKDKYYRIRWIGNGVTTIGDNAKYGFIITEHNKETFASDSETGQIRHIDSNDYAFDTPNNVTTRILESKVDNTVFVITIDYSKLVNQTAYDLNNNASSQVGYSTIIDESCYVYEAKIIESKPIVCTKSGSNLRVKFKYSNAVDLVLDFDLLGINQITSLVKVSRQTNTLPYPTYKFNAAIQWFAISTDWVSPYGILAVNNIVNPEGTFTVGGNHGTDGATGFATARQNSVEMFADNKPVNDGDTLYADKVVIKVTNYISASNAIDLATGAKRDSVKEIVTYTISEKSVEVSVTLEAMEEVQITRYAGLQATKAIYTELYWMLDKGAVSYNISTTPTEQISSGNRNDANVDRAILKTSGNDLLVVYMDRFIGLGDLTYMATGTPMSYYTTANKVYLHNIQSRTLTMAAGDIAYYRGGYTFMQSLNCPSSKNAYVIKLNDQRIYVVDFFNAVTTTYLETLADDLGKTIKVIEKSDSITCENYITSKGLKISATGYGQLKFTVN